MENKHDEDEVFEIQDFTTASDWERFTAAIESFLHDGQILSIDKFYEESEFDLNQLDWSEKHDTVYFSDFSFIITYHFIKKSRVSDVGKYDEEKEPNYSYLHDMMNPKNDFPNKVHCIVRWFGLKEFITLAPSDSKQPITSVSKVRLVLSSISCALNNTNCQIPLFIQINELQDKVFLGIGFNDAVRTDFEMAYVSSLPSSCLHLSGLLETFKSKIGNNLTTSPVFTSIRLTYSLKDFCDNSWCQKPPDFDSIFSSVGFCDLAKLPFGALSDPISELLLSATWPNISEYDLFTGDIHSDPKPTTAPIWTARLCSNYAPACLLADIISQFICVCNNKKSIVQLIGPDFDPFLNEELDFSHALQRLTSPGIPKLPISNRSHSRKSIRGPISEETISYILNYLFPDDDDQETSDFVPFKMADFTMVPDWKMDSGISEADIGISATISEISTSKPENLNVCPVVLKSISETSSINTRTEVYSTDNEPKIPENSEVNILEGMEQPVSSLPSQHPLTEILGKLKSCYIDSFVWRLTMIVTHAVYNLGGAPAVAHVLYELIAELRFRWDNALLVPGIPSGDPELGSCLINQKLQMLNCCIRARNRKEENSTQESFYETDDSIEIKVQNEASKNTSKISNITDLDSSVTEEEFFECEDASIESETFLDTNQYRNAPWEKPEGRLRKLGTQKLCLRDDFLYVPVTQDPAPYTEDTLESHTEFLEKLGTDSIGSNQRAKMMSIALLSDMESFKAANPGCVMEDFVRWYSPRDWIEDKQSNVNQNKNNKNDANWSNQNKNDSNWLNGIKGRLSERMSLPENLWQEIWNDALPVPARRQKRLFDDTREAESVLRWFSYLTPGQFCSHLLPTLFHASLCRITEDPVLYTLPSINNDPSMPIPNHQNSLFSQLEIVATRVLRLSRQPPNTEQYSLIQYQLELIERFMATCKSVRLKFIGHSNVNLSDFCFNRRNDGEEDLLESLVKNLLEQSEVKINEAAFGVQGKAIRKLFAEAQQESFSRNEPTKSDQNNEPIKFPEPIKSHDTELGVPIGREYLFRTHAPYPADHSRVLPHRMYAVVQKGSVRICGAISQDTVFN